jgi:hypothetical protein
VHHQPRGEDAERALRDQARAEAVEPGRLVPLQEHLAAVGQMAAGGAQQPPPQGVVRCVHQVAGQEDQVEPVGEVEVLDPAPVRPGPPHVGEHLRGVVDGDDVVAQRGQRVGDPPGAGAEVEDPCAGTGQAVHQFGFAHGRQPPVDLDRAAVVRHRSGTGARPAHRNRRT